MALTAVKLVGKDAVHQIPVIKETVPVSVCLRIGRVDDVQVRFLYINISMHTLVIPRPRCRTITLCVVYV